MKKISDFKDYDEDIFIDLDDDKDVRAINNGKTLFRVVVKKNGKQGVGFIGVSELRGKVVLRVTAGRGKDKPESHGKVTLRTYDHIKPCHCFGELVCDKWRWDGMPGEICVCGAPKSAHNNH
jgi:hypothetical protein